MPFSEEQFLRVFAEYNRAVWPAQLLLYAAAVAVVLLVVKKSRHSGRVIAVVLALLWLWMGVVYHLLFFAAINPAAYVFGALFVFEALLFFAVAVGEKPMAFRLGADAYGACAAALFTYSLIAYPALGHVLGRVYPASPTFGLPCPTTIFTFGLLLCAEGEVPKRLLPVPLAWSLLGTSAAAHLGVTEDYALAVAGLLSTVLIISRNGKLGDGKRASSPPASGRSDGRWLSPSPSSKRGAGRAGVWNFTHGAGKHARSAHAIRAGGEELPARTAR